MATVQCSKCTAERKGFRRELDSWRHKLIHCVGMIHVQFRIYLFIKPKNQQASSNFRPVAESSLSRAMVDR